MMNGRFHGCGVNPKRATVAGFVTDTLAPLSATLYVYSRARRAVKAYVDGAEHMFSPLRAAMGAENFTRLCKRAGVIDRPKREPRLLGGDEYGE